MWRAALVACLLSVLAPAAQAQDVTLSARDGSVTVSGRLIGYDGEFFRIDTAFGPLTLDGTEVRCLGTACPDTDAFVAAITWSAPGIMMDQLVQPWITAFAGAAGYTLEDGVDGAGTQVVTLAEAGSGTPAARITLQRQTPQTALADLASGQAQFALSRLDVGNTQMQTGIAESAAVEALVSARRVVALDAVVAAVAPSNGLGDVSVGALNDFLSRASKSWSSVGGPAEEVVLHLPPRGDAMFFSASALLDISDSDATGVTADPDRVAQDPFALSLLPLSQSGALRALDLLGVCGFAKRPTVEAIKTEDYPMVMPVYLYAAPQRLPRIARELRAFIRSADGQSVVSASPFVDLGVARIPFAAQADRLAQAVLIGAPAAGLSEVQRMVQDLQDAERLSLAFRFDGGATQLDSHSLANVQAIADALQQGRHDGERLIIAGFSDGQGDAASNLRLSRQRARVVRDAVLAMLPQPADVFRQQIEVRGYGEAAPIACDEDAWGRELNRRVEIWVRQR